MNMPLNRTTLSFLQSVLCLVLLAMPVAVWAFEWRPQVDVGDAPLNMDGCEQSQFLWEEAILGEPLPPRLITAGHICRGVLPSEDVFPIELRVRPDDPINRTFGYREWPEQDGLEYILSGYTAEPGRESGANFVISFSQGIRAVDVVNAWIVLPRIPAGFRLEIQGDVTLYSGPGADLRLGLDGATGNWLVDEIPDSDAGSWLVPQAALALHIARPLSDLAIRLVAVDERAAAESSFRIAFSAPPENFVARTVALPRVWFFPHEPVSLTETEPTAMVFSEPIVGLTEADVQRMGREVVPGSLSGDGVGFSYALTARMNTWLSLGILELPGGVVQSAELGLPNASSSQYFFWHSAEPALTVTDSLAEDRSTRMLSIEVMPPADVWISQDDGPFVPIPPGFGRLGLVETSTIPTTSGTHTLRFRLRDQQGRIYEDIEPYTFSVYPEPPIVRITSPVPAADNVSPTFTFESDTPVELFRCQIAESGWRDCTSPFNIGYLLADGTYTFSVRAYSAYHGFADLSESTTSQRFLINSSPPSVTIVPAQGSQTMEPMAQFTFVANEEIAAFRCRTASAGPLEPCETPFSYTASVPGSQTLYVEATDTAGQIGTRSYNWVWDTVAPETTITASPGPSASSDAATFRFASSESGSSFLCSLDGAEFTTCSTPSTYANLEPGLHSFSVVARDAAGNVDLSPATFGWEVTATPNTLIALAPAQVQFDTTASVEFSSTTPGAQFECQLNSTIWSRCTSPAVYIAQTPGSYVFSVRAFTTGGAVDATPASTTWTVANLQTTLTSPPGRTNSSGDIEFQFTTNALNSTFECRLTTGSTVGAWTTCASPMRYTGLPAGTHSFAVRYRTSDGSVDPTPATRNFQGRPPVVTLTRVPSNPGRSTSATFEFTSSVSGSTFRCSVDGRSAQACSSPFTVTGLRADDHSFEVTARVTGPLESETVGYEWDVVLYGPDTQISESPDLLNNLSSLSFEFSSPDAFTTGFQCRFDDTSWFACNTPLEIEVTQDGLHTLDVAAVDEFANRDVAPARVSWIRETVAPETTIVESPSVMTTSRSATFVLTSNEVGTFMCRVSPAEFAPCDARHNLAVPGDGEYIFEAYALDQYGNTDPSPAIFTWTVGNSEPPTLTLTSTPPALSNLDSVTFAFTGVEEGMTVRCLLDDVELPACISPVQIADIAHGEHEFRIEATNALGVFNAEAAVFEFETDLIAPETTLVAAPELLEDVGDAEFEFISDDSGAGFLCAVDGDDFVSCDSPYLISDLADGEHTFEVMAVDGVGNIEPEPETFVWTVDTLAPETTITEGPEALVSVASATLVFESTEAGTFVCSLDGEEPFDCESPLELEGLADGEHEITVAAVDWLGMVDETPAVWTWRVDTQAPDTLFESAPMSPSDASQGEFTISATEENSTFECSLDGGGFGPCSAVVVTSALADDAHFFEARAIDEAGNVDATPVRHDWLIDTRPPDTDGDGISDRDEGVRGTNPLLADTDEDGLCDGAVVVIGVCEQGEDTDGDGLVDEDETNPLMEDTDEDGLLDGVEILSETPTDALNADTDGDGYCDGPVTVEDVCEAGEDLNADGVVDDGETDPNNGEDYPGAGDGDVDDADAGGGDAGDVDVDAGDGDVHDADADDAQDVGDVDAEDAGDADAADAGAGDVDDADAGAQDVDDDGDADDTNETDTAEADASVDGGDAQSTDTGGETDAAGDATPNADAVADTAGDAVDDADSDGGASSGGGGGGCSTAGHAGTAPVWALALLLVLARPRRAPGRARPGCAWPPGD